MVGAETAANRGDSGVGNGKGGTGRTQRRPSREDNAKRRRLHPGRTVAPPPRQYRPGAERSLPRGACATDVAPAQATERSSAPGLKRTVRMARIFMGSLVCGL